MARTKRLKTINRMKQGIASAGFRKLVKANFSMGENIQDAEAATKIQRTFRGQRRRLVPVYKPAPEAKFKSASIQTPATFSTTPGPIALLNGMVQGTTASTRVGAKISIKSVLMRVQVYSEAGETDYNNHLVRLMLVVDREAKGASPVMAELLEDATAPGCVTSPLNSLYAGRYKILWDKIFTNVSQTESQSKYISHNIIFKRPLEVDFNAGNAGTVADIDRNSVYLIGCYAGDTAPYYRVYGKITYYDN